MAKRYIFNFLQLLLGVWLIPTISFAQSERTIDVRTPGSLPSLIGENNKNTITKLTLTGSLDGTDIKFIREMAGGAYNSWEYNDSGQLSELDLSKAKIVSGGAAYYYDGTDYSSEDNVVGTFMFYRCHNLVKLRLPNSVTAIGNYGISYLDLLTELDFGTGIKEIGEYAVSSNYALKELGVPENVTSVGVGAFSDNKALEKINLSKQVEVLPNDCFNGCTSLKKIECPSTIISIGNSAFSRCENLTEISLPTGLQNLGDYAFSNCGNLTKITLPSSITVLNPGVFYYCESLAEIHLGETLTDIASEAFYHSGLKKVRIPDSIERLESRVFSYCEQLREVEFGKKLSVIGDYAFSHSGLTNIVIPGSVESIGVGAFRDNSELETVTISQGVKQIGESAFCYCYSLKSISIPTSISVLSHYIFEGCTGLETVELHCAIDALPDGLFSGCVSLQTVKLPSNLHAIGIYTFGGCENLKAFTIPSTVTELGSSAFSGCSSLTEMTIPSGITSIPDNLFKYCSNLQKVSLPDGLTSIGSFAFSDCTQLKNISIPPTVEYIGASAFWGCTALASINWPEKTTVVNGYVFSYCSSLESVSLPETITSIESGAFYQSGIRSFTVPPLVTSIEDLTFYECEQLETINLPDGLLEIQDHAFAYCTKLKSIIIPANVTYVSSYAFRECQALTDIHAYPQNPPEAFSDTFYGLSLDNCTLYVPEGCLLAYQTAEGWNIFKQIQEEGVSEDKTPLAQAEWTILKQFYEQTNGKGWLRPWTFGDTPANTKTLSGVISRNGHVVRISLSNNNLKGQLSPSLLILPELSELDLSGNELSGNFAAILTARQQTATASKYSPLTYLDISDNLFTGNLGLIGQAFGNLSTLKAADCHFSEVQPALPEQVTTIDISRQTIDKEIEYDLLVSEGAIEDIIPSVMLYDVQARNYDNSVSLLLSDRLDDQMIWWMYMVVEDANWYINNSWWDNNRDYRLENGRLLFAKQEDDRGHVLRVRFNFKPGDANFDGVLNINDLQRIINKALNQYDDPFNYTAANLVADDTINVQDVVLEIDLLLKQNVAEQSSARQMAQTYSRASQTSKVYVYVEDGNLVLNSSEPLAAFDLTLPTGNFEWLQPVPGFLHALRQYDGKSRVIGYSLSGSMIPSGRTVLARTDAKHVSTAHLSDAKATSISALCNTQPTGVTTTDTGVTVRTAQHHVMLSSLGTIQNVEWAVHSLSGETIAQGTIDTLPAGVTTIATLPGGSYIVTVKGAQVNMIKKVSVK